MKIVERVEQVKYADLKLGDIVDFEMPYGYATVVEVTPKRIVCFRPYVHTGDFTCGADDGGLKVLEYIGTESVSLWADADRTIKRVRTGVELR